MTVRSGRGNVYAARSSLYTLHEERITCGGGVVDDLSAVVRPGDLCCAGNKVAQLAAGGRRRHELDVIGTRPVGGARPNGHQ